MSKPGPKRIPLAILRQRGSWLANQRTEPALSAQTPEPPAWLDGEALVEWNRVVPILSAAGILTAADRSVLVCYCEIWGEYCEIRELCRKDGKIVPMLKTSNGNPIVNPAVGIRNTLRKQLKEYAGLLGLSPADRSNVTPAGPPSESDKLAAILAEFTPQPKRKVKG